ncbi:hypothetical protein V6N12_045200 [Hibiscus sabdariffa]|uniref:Uncharacterized protein n=1 Tax=Hibiscus sabdariffa TaxID=183260 RepID=A0ABR2G2A9_9ROSI
MSLMFSRIASSSFDGVGASEAVGTTGESVGVVAISGSGWSLAVFSSGILSSLGNAGNVGKGLRLICTNVFQRARSLAPTYFQYK